MSGELISGSILCLAAEFAVASELCRRNIYTQLTLGKQKRTDLLLMSSNGGFSRVEVKAKQGREWPNCRGIYGPLAFLVFVDYAGRGNTDRPDFFVLTEKDWLRVLNKKIQAIHSRRPNKRIIVDDENVPIFIDEINKRGKPYKGMGVLVEDIQEYREAWVKITSALEH